VESYAIKGVTLIPIEVLKDIVTVQEKKPAGAEIGKIKPDLASDEFTIDTQPEEDNGKDHIFDGDLTTRWAADAMIGSGDKNATSANVVVPFDKAYKFTGFEASWFAPSARQFYFNVFVSDDGKNWKLMELVSDGITAGNYEGSNYTRGIDCYVTAEMQGDPDVNNNATKAIKVEFLEPVSAKYIKVQQYGTNLSTWASLTDLQFFGY
jgi:hypothetical protein